MIINLLPPETKNQYRYARRNTRLVRWVVAMAFAFVGLAVISAGGIWYLHQTANAAQVQADAATASLKQQNQQEVQKQIKEIGDNIKLTVQVLSKEVLFSQLLKQIAVVTPSNAKLANLTIGQVQGGIDITANTTDYNAATQLQVNITDPANKIFSKADIVSINCSSTGTATDTVSTYPCTVVIRALFADNNPFLFVTNAKKAKP